MSGMSQAKLAECLGFAAHKIRDIESGKVKISIDVAEAMEEKLGISFRWLMTGQGSMYKPAPKANQQIQIGNGQIQAGGGIFTSGSGRIAGSQLNGGGASSTRLDETRTSDMKELILLLENYGTPKLLADLREKLLQIKKMVEGE